jgi:CspA family cold shock protein
LEPTPWPDGASGTPVRSGAMRPSPACLCSTGVAALAGAAAFAVGVRTDQHAPVSEGERRMPTGTVKWFNPDKGFGFIQPQDGGKDVFVHITAVQAAGLQSLNENQKVTYEVVTERGKQAAANLKLA